MTFGNLLLSQGGGIDIADLKVEQENSAVICIGLGGTGIDALKDLKSKVYEEIKPDETGNYPHIKFLAVDAGSQEVGNSNLNTASEFFDISQEGDLNLLMKGRKDIPYYQSWLNPNLLINRASTGSRAIRQLGRFLFMEKASEFSWKIRQLVRETKMGLINPDVYIHIFTGLGGGTGSGIFLDACYLIRKGLEMEINTGNIIGHFFLPDVNLEKVEAAEYIKVNGYAAMQELDYCMNFRGNGDKWSQEYPQIGLVESKESPVDICYLISSTNENGNVAINPYQNALKVATDEVVEEMKLSGLLEEWGISSTHSPFIILYRNILAMGGSIRRSYGAAYHYLTIGSATVKVPYKEMLTYLTSKVFSRFAASNHNKPSNADVEDFMKGAHLTLDDILVRLSQGFDRKLDFPNIEAKVAKTDISVLTNFYNEYMHNATVFISKNALSLSAPLENYVPDEDILQTDSSSLIKQIFLEILKVSKDYQKGLAYATELLDSKTPTSSIISLIKDYIFEVEKKLEDKKFEETNLQKIYQQAQKDFSENSNIINLKFKYRAYLESIRTVILTKTQISYYQEALKVFHILLDQLQALEQEFLLPILQIFDDLQETFLENKQYLSDSMNSKQKFAEFDAQLFTIDELSPELDRAVDSLNFDKLFADFMSFLLSDKVVTSLRERDEEAISMLISQYFSELFKNLRDSSLTDYLKEKYGYSDTKKLSEIIQKNLLEVLDKKAVPLFWTSTTYHPKEAVETVLVFYPAQSSELKAAVESFVNRNRGYVAVSTSTIDRVSILHLNSGVPLYGYAGSQEYERRTVENAGAGLYLYENSSADTGLNRYKLPVLTPYAMMGDSTPVKVKERADKAKELFEKAEAAQIIIKNVSGEFIIRRLSDEFMDEFQRYSDMGKSEDGYEHLEAAAKLTELVKNITFDEHVNSWIRLQNDGSANLDSESKRSVRLDHFVKAPKLQEVVAAELEKYEKVQSWKENFKEK